MTREGFLFAKPDSAFVLAGMQYELASKVNHLKWKTEARNTQGISLHIQGNYIKAIDYYNKAVQLAEASENKKALAGALNNIGIIYKDQGNYSQALEHFERSLKIKEEINDKNGVANSLGNIGSIYISQDKDHEALKLFERGLEIQKALGNQRGIAGFLNNIGSVYLRVKAYSDALEYFEESLEIREKLGDKKGIASSVKNVARVYQEQGDHSKAIKFGQEALRVAQEADVILEENEAAFVLYESYKAQGNSKMSLKMHELYVATKDSIKNEETQDKIIQLDYKLKYEKIRLSDSITNAELQKVKDAELAAEKALNDKLEIESDQQRMKAYFLYGGLFLALVFIGFIVNRYRVTIKQKSIIEEHKQEVEKKNGEILDSIKYAKRIQSAILPQAKLVKSYLQDSFILYKPKDIVAGDFYWLEPVEEAILFAVADCTGHGVPGALVSVVCNNSLNRSVREYGLRDPGEILNKAREIVVHEFEKSEEDVKDGMDIALCKLVGKKLYYAGANNPIWIVRGDEIIESKPTKQPIGKYDDPTPYETTVYDLQAGDTVYIFSDGYVDQFGGENNKKFKASQLRKLLVSIQNEPMTEQCDLVNKAFEDWKGNEEQIDDVCMIGLRV